MTSFEEMPKDMREAVLSQWRPLFTPILSAYYLEKDDLREAVEAASKNTASKIMERGLSSKDSEGLLEAARDGVLDAVEEVPPDKPTELVKNRVRILVDSHWGGG